MDCSILKCGGAQEVVSLALERCAGQSHVKNPLTDRISVFDQTFRIEIERKKAGFSTWYELSRRSVAEAHGQHGTFRDVIRLLPKVTKMGLTNQISTSPGGATNGNWTNSFTNSPKLTSNIFSVPIFWLNMPDILPHNLVEGGENSHIIRFILAAILVSMAPFISTVSIHHTQER